MTEPPPEKPYHDYRLFLRRRYGETLYRVPIDLGLGCPHRSQTDNAGGCVYCGDAGARGVAWGGAQGAPGPSCH